MRDEIIIPDVDIPFSDGTFRILKTMENEDGETTFVLMNDGYGEILTLYSWDEATKLVDMLNANTDSGWEYSIMRAGK
tara:strand:+ start:114 stop:347 length:234 start_codon:yes stop_codon:yes gene_type:complete